MIEKEFKRLIFKMINDLKNNSNEQTNEVNKLIQDLVAKFNKKLRDARCF
jgi:hypothetical protein